ncbi:MAG: DUF4340 domain-containing protein [Opitutales bacterium]|jgi:hypothetical protein
MRFKLTILLVLLNVALFCTLFYMDKNADSARIFEQQSTLVLQPGSIEQADSLALDGPGAPVPWLIRKQADAWQMQRPQQWPVNRFAVENILDQLRFLRMETSFSIGEIERSGMTLADYGLDNPSVLLTIGEGEGSTLLRIGAPTEIGGRLYVLSPDGQKVYVTTRDILRALLVKLDDLRSTQVFNLPAYTISSLSLQRADGARVRLSKRGTAWEFESPIRVAADGGAVDSLLADMMDLKVRAFVQQDPAAQGLLSPRMRIGVEAADQRQSLLIGSADSEGLLYAKLENSPEVFTIDAGILDRVAQAQEALRERKFDRFDKDKLGEIRVQMGDQSATLQKLETGEWQVLRQNGEGGVRTWTADQEIVDALVNALGGLHALRFVSDAPSEADLAGCGFKDPQRVITLRLGTSTRTLMLGDLEPKLRGVFAKLDEEPFVYEVSATILDLLRPVPLYYRTRLLESLPPAARLQRLRLVNIKDGTVVLDIGPDAGQDWEQVLAAQPNGNATALSALLNFARSGKAKDFLAARYDEAMPLGDGKTLPWDWRLEADIELPSGTSQSTRRTLSYVFSSPVGGNTQFGASKTLELMFSLREDLIDALRQLTFDHPQPSLAEIPANPDGDQPAAPKADVPEADRTEAPAQ